ncbi:flagellar hook-length control protein FliK [Flavobacterium sp. MXW15]|uniref:Flagellar hook-length control protein FliK n=1 Tax=Xanthomonas chitinilytica TaxID=2989819 RepID=A0ABT3JVX7_9XANT|nr:flagellar hook-length control protein FliK [Xanthomonas sp. H13-6]MCW4455200.1 flagellar hook-length control protein FliK [Flavobacterium sp. MXW15]MCW4472631.1 flagellar hook-length control protein FliK [Xanthomonas sp. H13-6]
MNALSILAGSAGSSAAKAGTGVGTDGQGGPRQDFGALLESGGKPAPASSGSTTPAPPSPAKPGSATQADAATSNETALPVTDDAPAGTADRRDTDSSDSDDDTWPPPGLVGIGVAVVPEPAPAALPVLPAATSATPAATVPAPATGDILAAAADASPGNAAAPALPVASDMEVLPDGAADAPELTLAAFAGTGSSAAEGAEQSPANVLLQGLSAAAEVRGTAPAAPFLGSPTATPDLNSEGFDEAIGARLSWLADQKIGHAHIRITPHDLGPVEVRLQLDGDRVHASFTSAHADVRQALEGSLSRLREMLGEQGLQLAHADVGQQQNPQEGGEADAGRDPLATTGDRDAGHDSAGITARTLHQRGLLDTYA